MSYGYDYPIAAQAAESERAAFIRRTYTHLAGAILAFVGLEAVLINLDVTHRFMAEAIGGGGNGVLLVIFFGFIGASFLARYWARSSASRELQYAGLALYVVAEAIIFVPILYVANNYFPDTHIIGQAGILTLAMFAGLTAMVFTTKRDFSFLGPILMIGCCLTFGLVIAAMIFQFSLGLVFCYFSVALACGFILYGTSNVLHHYHTDQHVGAALELFASVAYLFYYILSILMQLDRR